MKVLLFGATGMVGQGVLRECLLDPSVTGVVAVVRSGTGRSEAKLTEVIHRDFADYTGLAEAFTDVDACLFCLGVSAVGRSEADYRRVSYDYPLAAARALLDHSPKARFVYVTGQGTNAAGRAMWARVKGEAENALLALSPEAYMFRPGFIQPLHGVRSRTRLYSAVYAVTGPLFPLLRRVAPGAVTTTERVGRAMVRVGAHGADARILGNPEINALGA